ncbi:MAG: hypothetical protein U1C50_01685 [Patescibacteria group bacterium]|nr:hypothetical protein [Patescibacteria group bacterium]
MKSKRLLLWFYRLSWKKLLAISTFALVVAIIPLALRSANSPTRTRSEAALITKTQPVTSEFVTPKGPPEIYLVDHFFGKAQDAVLVHGANLGGLSDNTSVSLAGQTIPSDNLVTWTDDYIEFKLPDNARSGKVSVNILGQSTEWPGMFWVTDQTTTAELKLEKLNDLQAKLSARNINAASGLLLWLLIFQGEGNLDIQPANGVSLESQAKSLPLGRVYELKAKFIGGSDWTTLATITKTEGQAVGIARAEAGANQPIKVHPLYVSF